MIAMWFYLCGSLLFTFSAARGLCIYAFLTGVAFTIGSGVNLHLHYYPGGLCG